MILNQIAIKKGGEKNEEKEMDSPSDHSDGSFADVCAGCKLSFPAGQT